MRPVSLTGKKIDTQKLVKAFLKIWPLSVKLFI